MVALLRKWEFANLIYSPEMPTSVQQMSVRGLNGQYYFGNTSNDVISNAPGFSMGMDPLYGNTIAYILPYDQYAYDVQTNTGSTLYCVDISNNPNPITSEVGFTKGTIVYQFSGVPNAFTGVNVYSSNVVFLKTPENNTFYYISSSNLVTSNENYIVYRTQVSEVSQINKNLVTLSSGKIGNIITGPGKAVFFGPTSYFYGGDKSIPPLYSISREGTPYYDLSSDGIHWSWINTTNKNTSVFGYYFCYGDGTLYLNPQGYNILISAGGFTNNSFASYYDFPPLDLSGQPDFSFPPTYTTTVTLSWYIGYYDICNNKVNYPPPNSNILYGNRGNPAIDPIVTKVIGNAWQMFYPNFKMNLIKKSNSTSPITNTTDLVSSNYPFYPHTSMFFYSSFNKMVSDLSGLWGQEKATNFLASDVSSGYYFMSYINTINLSKSTDFTNTNSSYNYLAVRGYSPTEKFKCLLRFYLPGRYDFGYISLYNMMEEAEKIVLKDLSGTALVNPTYNRALNLFNVAFKITSNFGGNSVPGFGGSNLTFTGFSNFMTQYQGIYISGASNAALLNAITNNVKNNVRSYISQYLGEILPSYVLQRDIFTASLTFSILFKSALSPAYLVLADEWGLGYNLGFDKADTEYSTVQRATSFFKILDDYIYLRLNPEFTMNRMDTTALENLSVTHEPTGIVNQYAAKLLLAPFGNYATTIIQNPIQFNPVLSSLDRLSFQWTDKAGNQLNNLECEWNAVVQIQERITAPKVGSTIPRPNK